MSSAAAPSFAAVTEQPGQPASRIQLEMLEARYAWAVEQAEGKDILEACCGAGIGLPALASVARSVQAGDVDAESLDAARVACGGILNVELRALDAQRLPFPRETFDLVLLFEAIYYLSSFRQFLKEAKRVLRPGGTLLIVTANPAWTGFNRSPLHTRYWFAEELRVVLGEEGFTADVQGAFPESAGCAASVTGWVRRAAVALHLVPRTMRGKALLKRAFYGSLTALPQRLANVSLPPMLAAPSKQHRILYVTARKAIS